MTGLIDSWCVICPALLITWWEWNGLGEGRNGTFDRDSQFESAKKVKPFVLAFCDTHDPSALSLWRHFVELPLCLQMRSVSNFPGIGFSSFFVILFLHYVIKLNLLSLLIALSHVVWCHTSSCHSCYVTSMSYFVILKLLYWTLQTRLWNAYDEHDGGWNEITFTFNARRCRVTGAAHWFWKWGAPTR